MDILQTRLSTADASHFVLIHALTAWWLLVSGTPSQNPVVALLPGRQFCTNAMLASGPSVVESLPNRSNADLRQPALSVVGPYALPSSVAALIPATNTFPFPCHHVYALKPMMPMHNTKKAAMPSRILTVVDTWRSV